MTKYIQNNNDFLINIPSEESDYRKSSVVSSDIENTIEMDVQHTTTVNDPQQRPDEIDSRYAQTKNVAEGMMDIALLTANANQLRFLFTYNTESKTCYAVIGLIITSLIIQIAVGIGLIFARRLKKTPNNRKTAKTTKDVLVVGVFLVTVINIFATAFTTTDKVNTTNQQHNVF